MLSGVLIAEETDGVGHTGSGDSTVVDVKALEKLLWHAREIAKSE
jgi:hypothetical protein